MSILLSFSFYLSFISFHLAKQKTKLRMLKIIKIIIKIWQILKSMKEYQSEREKERERGMMMKFKAVVEKKVRQMK